MSTHCIEVIEIGEINKHPNADKMELTRVWGWQCCIGKDQFKTGDKAIYIPPDYTVPTDRPEFAFLKREGRNRERITVRRFRGELSQGLLIKANDEMIVGDNIMEILNVERYEPPIHFDSEQFVPGPSGIYSPKFDVENYQRYQDMFQPDEIVIVTEKLHGANARYVYARTAEGEWTFFCGSRTNWMAVGNNPWRNAVVECPAIEGWCRANPEIVLYGEVFGNVQNLKYGCGGKTLFAAFAILRKEQWVDYDEMHDWLEIFNVPMAPYVYRGPFDRRKIALMAEDDSRWPNAKHLSEGVVIVPEHERFDNKIGRVCLKIVSNRYLMHEG